MTEKQFWCDDPNLFEAYQEMYYENLSYEAYIYGLYDYHAVANAVAGVVLGDKKAKYVKKPFVLYKKKAFRSAKLKEDMLQEYEQGKNYQLDWTNELARGK